MLQLLNGNLSRLLQIGSPNVICRIDKTLYKHGPS